MVLGLIPAVAGLEKLTNLSRSLSSVNDRVFPVELTEISDWKSMSEQCYIRNSEKPFQGLSAGILVHIPLYCRFPVY